MGTGWLVITTQPTYTQATLGVGHQSSLGEKPACETKRRTGGEKLNTPASAQAGGWLWMATNVVRSFFKARVQDEKGCRSVTASELKLAGAAFTRP